MGVITTEANKVWKDGEPGAPHFPVKSEIRAWAGIIDGVAGSTSDDAARAEEALRQIEDLASGSPTAPSILNKAEKDFTNVPPEVMARRSNKAAPFNNLVAFLGDSITAASTTNTANELRNSNRGPLTWLGTLTQGRFVSRQDLVFGVSGDTSWGALARIQPVIDSGAGTCMVLIGTNDIATNDFTATITALDGIYTALADANMQIIALPILPRTLVTATNYGFANRVNRWIAEAGDRYPNFRFIDPYLFGEPYSLTMSARNGYTYDGLHPVAIGMRYIMKPVADFLNTLRPIPPRSIRTVTDHYVSGANPTGTANPNPMMAGTAGTTSAGGSTLTGTAPDSWNLFADAGGGTITGLNVAGSESVSATGLVCARVVLSGTATGGYQTVVGLNQYNFPGGFVAGEKVQFIVEVEVEGGTIGVSGVAAYLQATQGGVDKFAWDGHPVVSDDLTADNYSGLLVTPVMELTHNPTLTSCGVWIFLKNVGADRSIAVKVVSAAVRRVVE